MTSSKINSRPCTDEDMRHSRRVTTERPVQIFVEEGIINGKMIDISNLGTGILIKALPLTETFVGIEFSLPTSPEAPIKLSGHVVHNCRVRKETLIGIRFEKVPARYQAKLREFINSKY